VGWLLAGEISFVVPPNGGANRNRQPGHERRSPPNSSRIVRWRSSNRSCSHQEIAATERSAYALAPAAFRPVLSRDRLMAEVELGRTRHTTRSCCALTFEAAFAQDAFVNARAGPMAAIGATFALRYAPPEHESGDELNEEEAFEPLVTDFYRLSARRPLRNFCSPFARASAAAPERVLGFEEAGR